MPITSKKAIEQSFHLSKDNIMILSGLNQKENTKKESSIPVLKDIPIAGWLFKYESNSFKHSNLSIIFELIEDFEAPQKFIDKIQNWEIK